MAQPVTAVCCARRPTLNPQYRVKAGQAAHASDLSVGRGDRWILEACCPYSLA